MTTYKDSGVNIELGEAVVDMFGGALGEPKAVLTGAAHITGGGIPGKLGRALAPTGRGAVLFDLFDPPEAMRQLRELGDVPLEDAYKTWNMGNGMLLVTPEPMAVLAVAKEHGLEARIAGEVTSAPGITTIAYTGDVINF